MKTKVHILVSERVQGVFFRPATAQEAQARGVVGWVRNLPDGAVEAVFNGERALAMIAFCKHGPQWTRVRNVDVQWEPYSGSYESFEVL